MWLLWALYIHTRIKCFSHNQGIGYFSLCCREGKLGKEGSHSLRLYSKPLQPESRLLPCSPFLFPFYSVLDPSPWASASTFRKGLPASLEPLCFLGDFNAFRLLITKAIYPSDPTQMQTNSSYFLWLFGTGRVSKWPPRISKVTSELKDSEVSLGGVLSLSPVLVWLEGEF